MNTRELLDDLLEFAKEYPDELDMPIKIQDDNGIYESLIIGTDLANGLWIICETQPLEDR